MNSVNVLVQTPVLNGYAEPRTDSEQVTQLLLGMSVSIRDETDGWCFVQGPDGYCGWGEVSGFISVGVSKEDSDLARILPLYANLRHLPSSRSGPMLCVPCPVQLPVAERREEWVGLQLPDGRIGWVESGRIEDAAPRPRSVPDLISTVRQFLGVPYLWGGTSAFGLDCSGFVQAVFGMHGVALPRDANQQADLGETIAREDLTGGDLVYFAASSDSPQDRITHVALAVDGDSILHALGGREVVETPLSDGGHFWGARRHLTAESEE